MEEPASVRPPPSLFVDVRLSPSNPPPSPSPVVQLNWLQVEVGDRVVRVPCGEGRGTVAWLCAAAVNRWDDTRAGAPWMDGPLDPSEVSEPALQTHFAGSGKGWRSMGAPVSARLVGPDGRATATLSPEARLCDVLLPPLARVRVETPFHGKGAPTPADGTPRDRMALQRAVDNPLTLVARAAPAEGSP
jgi:hypothetical protein